MFGFEDLIKDFLMEVSHHPVEFYIGIIAILFASSFGLPLPEEIVLLSSGMVAYMSLQESAQTGLPPTIHPVTVALVCFAAVLSSDILVFSLGKKYGLPLLQASPLKRLLHTQSFARVQNWTTKYGAWACALFRFTPGIRFPGHFMCGAMQISYFKFLMTDGVAALLTVPTQVLFIAYYGDEILAYLKQFKVTLLTLFVLSFAVWFIYRELRTRKNSYKTDSL